jgi:UDP-glucose 4-epimerase
MTKNILVTGGAGYIGSHAAYLLKEKGYTPIILDNLVYGHQEIVEEVLGLKFIKGDVGDEKLVNEILTREKIYAVMHFSAYAYVGESVEDPIKYYNNNVVSTINLLNCMVKNNVKNIIFSSTCATYGEPMTIPIPEEHPQNPINPYGQTKLVIEQAIKDYNHAYGLNYIIFRYFNAAGASPTVKIGEDHTPETHLIPLVLDAAIGKRDTISIFGTNYPTKDGTCIRDYIHVDDISEAHISGLEHLISGKSSDVFNLGSEQGFTVREVIETAKKITGNEIKIIEAERRPGDPPSLIGNGRKAIDLLNWKIRYKNLDDIIEHAWNWHKTMNQKTK